jgi:hypothetical protein
LRGRAAGEIPRLLSETVKQENSFCQSEIIPNEIEAVSKAIREIKENEVVVIFYDQLTAVLDVLSKTALCRFPRLRKIQTRKPHSDKYKTYVDIN